MRKAEQSPDRSGKAILGVGVLAASPTSGQGPPIGRRWLIDCGVALVGRTDNRFYRLVPLTQNQRPDRRTAGTPAARANRGSASQHQTLGELGGSGST